MFIRFTNLTIPAERVSEAKAVYTSEIAAVIRKQKGNQGALLLEPEENGDEFISLTLWQNEDDIKAFEATEVYKKVLGRIKEFATKAQQKYYKVADEVGGTANVV